MGFCNSFMQCLFITVNVIVWLTGATLLGVGIWMLVDDNVSSDFINKVYSESSLNIAAYVVISFGAFVFLVGFFGCAGAICESRCMLGMYIACLLMVCIAELTVGIYLAVNKDDVDDKFKNYYVKHKDSPSIAEIQKEYKCCGWNGPSDYGNKSPKSCKTYKKGCKDSIKDWMDKHKTAIIITTCVALVLQIGGLICASCFLCQLKTNRMDV